MLQQVEGNVFDHVHDNDGKTVILHICNNVGGYGKGFAKELAEVYPKARVAYRKWYQSKNGFALGEVQFVKVEDGVYVVNMVAQEGFRTENNPIAVRYEALEECLRKIKNSAVLRNAEIILPKIGTGYGGGQWGKIKSILEKELEGASMTVYEMVSEEEQERRRKEAKREYRKEMELVRQIPIIEFAQTIGLTPVKRGNKYFSFAEADSVMVNVRRNTFTRYSKSNVYGGVIEFAMEFCGYTREEAEKALRKELGMNPNFHPKRLEALKEYAKNLPEEKREELVLPKAGNTNKHVYAYLRNTRKIKNEVIDFFLKNGYLYEDERRNCVFVTRDKEGKPNFASLRSTGDKKIVMDIPGCDYQKCFFIEGKEEKILFVAEAIIDLQSLMCMVKKPEECNWLSLNGVEKTDAIFYHLAKHPDIKMVYLGFDNDEAGKKAAEKVEKQLEEMGWNGKVKKFIPVAVKDWNEQIVTVRLQKAKEIDVTVKPVEVLQYKTNSLDLCVKILTNAREDGRNAQMSFQGKTLYAKDVLVGEKEATMDLMYQKVYGKGREEYIRGTDITLLPEIVQDMGNTKLEYCVESLIRARENCQNLVILYQGKQLRASDVIVGDNEGTMEKFFQEVTGMSKSEFEVEEAKRKTEFAMAQQKVLAKVPEWIEKGNEVLPEEKREEWKRWVYQNVRSERLGKDVPRSLEALIKNAKQAPSVADKEKIVDILER